MIEAISFGGASASIPNSSFHTMPPHIWLRYTFTEDVPKNTVVFLWVGPGGSKPPAHYDESTWYPPRNWFFPDTPLPNPVVDSHGTPWGCDFPIFKSLLYPFLRRCPNPGAIKAGDYVEVAFTGYIDGPTRSSPGFGYDVWNISLRPINWSYTAGFSVFGFRGISVSNIIADLALSGYGSGGLSEWHGQVIDTTPLGGQPYSPRLQLAMYGAAKSVLTPSSAIYFDSGGGYTPYYPTSAAGNTDRFIIPTGWEKVAEVDTQFSDYRPWLPPDYVLQYPDLMHYEENKALLDGGVTTDWHQDIYWKYIEPGVVEDTIEIGAGKGGRQSNYYYAQVATYRVVEVPEAGGLDLLELSDNMLVRSYVEDGAIKIQVSYTAGRTWVNKTNVTNNADPLAIGDLSADQHDYIYCWYHDTSGNAKGKISKDHGASWQNIGSINNLLYPRVVRLSDRVVLVGYSSTQLVTYAHQSQDSDFELVSGMAVTCPSQSASIVVDRHEVLHLGLYTADGKVVHYDSEHLTGWRGPHVLAPAGTLVTLVPGHSESLVIYRTADRHCCRRVNASFTSALAAPVAMPILEENYLGSIDSERALCYYVVGRGSDGSLKTYFSKNFGSTWQPTP